jgi:hypothetical protein
MRNPSPSNGNRARARPPWRAPMRNPGRNRARARAMERPRLIIAQPWPPPMARLWQPSPSPAATLAEPGRAPMRNHGRLCATMAAAYGNPSPSPAAATRPPQGRTMAKPPSPAAYTLAAYAQPWPPPMATRARARARPPPQGRHKAAQARNRRARPPIPWPRNGRLWPPQGRRAPMPGNPQKTGPVNDLVTLPERIVVNAGLTTRCGARPRRGNPAWRGPLQAQTYPSGGCRPICTQVGCRTGTPKWNDLKRFIQGFPPFLEFRFTRIEMIA